MRSLAHCLLPAVTRYDREREAGDEEAKRGGGQAEGRDSSQGPRADAEKRGHRSSKPTSSTSQQDLEACIFIFIFSVLTDVTLVVVALYSHAGAAMIS